MVLPNIKMLTKIIEYTQTINGISELHFNTPLSEINNNKNCLFS